MDQRQALLHFLIGSLGSLLPDIDSNSSNPLQMGFTLSSILLAFLLMFSMAGWFPSVLELLLIWLCAYLVLRGLIFALFNRITTHRGIIHSIPASLFFGLLTTALSHRIWGLAELQAWIAGGFMAFGYLLHLLLDELSSVNLFGVRTQRSFGSALKLVYRKSTAATLYIYVAATLAFLLTPPAAPVWQEIQRQELPAKLKASLFPKDGWFRVPRPKP